MSNIPVEEMTVSTECSLSRNLGLLGSKYVPSGRLLSTDLKCHLPTSPEGPPLREGGLLLDMSACFQSGRHLFITRNDIFGCLARHLRGSNSRLEALVVQK